MSKRNKILTLVFGVLRKFRFTYIYRYARTLGKKVKEFFSKLSNYEVEVEGWGLLFKVGIFLVLLFIVLQMALIGTLLTASNQEGKRVWRAIWEEPVEPTN